MKITSTLSSVAAGTLGLALLAGLAGAASADETEYGTDGVDVTVEIQDLAGPGTLALTVSGDSAVLTENGSDAVTRQFKGTLPTVTVTDTRDTADVPDDAYWYVVGSATDFVGDASQPDITADHLGWTPRLVDGGASGLVTEGDEVGTVLDGDVGLVDQELLAMAWDSKEINTEGSWSAKADLFLRTPTSVATGQYASTLTLSLFE